MSIHPLLGYFSAGPFAPAPLVFIMGYILPSGADFFLLKKLVVNFAKNPTKDFIRSSISDIIQR